MKPTPSGPDPSTPPPEAVEERAEELTAEEKRAGVDDPAALAEAARAASRLSKSQLAAMGDRGEAWFRQHFERNAVLSRLEAELEDVTR